MSEFKDIIMGITVVVPTAGRPTITRCLDSLQPKNQNGWGMNVVVVYDTNAYNKGEERPEGYFSPREVANHCDKRRQTFYKYDAGYSDWGYPQLDYAYRQKAKSHFIMNIGDDDVLAPNAFDNMMSIIKIHGIKPYMFQATLFPSPHRGNREPVTIWNDSDRSLARQTITGQNLLVPNIPHLFGQMSDDCEFIQSTIENWRGVVQWVPIVTSWCY